MRSRISLPLVLLALALLAPVGAHAQQVRVGNSGADTLSRIVARVPQHRARHAITTRDGKVSLLLVERGIVLQFSDRGLEEVTLPEADAEEEGLFARLIGSMVRGGVRTLLDHGIEYPLAALAGARYEDGRLRFVANDGEEVFRDVDIDGTAVMENFRPRDARAFVARFREAKARGSL